VPHLSKLVYVPIFVAISGCAPQYIEPNEGDLDDLAIVGGTNAPAGLFPHQVSIQTRSGFHFCGGSLIGDRHVLTAAHCVQGERASQLRVAADLVNLSSGGQVFSVTAIDVHSSYNSSTSDSDIALLTLDRSTGSIGKVALMDPGSEATLADPGTDSVVTGWGALSESGGSPDRLQQVTVPILSNTECNDAYDGDITSRMVCAGLLGVGGKDSCQGDSGGPLVVDDGGGWAQVGVVSFGFGCARAQFPGVYTRVSSFESWIAQRVPDALFVDQEPTEPDPDPGDPGDDDTVTLDTADGSASASATLARGETHLYRVVLDGPSTVTASTSSSIDTWGDILDVSGNLLGSDDDSGPGRNFDVTVTDVEGEIIVAVRGYDGNVQGSYTLDVTVVGGGDGEELPQVGEGMADLGASATLNAGDVHDYAFEVVGPSGVPVDIFATSTGSTDVIGSFVDASGDVLVENDDLSSTNRNFRIEASVVPGVYTLRVRGYQNSAGAYSITLGDR
jgi:secreted trypsin-like serine protease